MLDEASHTVRHSGSWTKKSKSMEEAYRVADKYSVGHRRGDGDGMKEKR